MAEVVAVRLALGIAWKLFAPRTASMIENGDVAEEKLRQLLLNEFQKLHEHLNALRRKELVAAVAFVETGYDLMDKDADASKEEFRKARDAALMAFGVVPEVNDKVLATKILITSTINEFRDNKEAAKTLCLKYISRMNTLPEITKICQVTFEKESNLKSRLLGLTGRATRHELLKAVADTNYNLWEFFLEEFDGTPEPWPRVVWEKSNIHPVHDLCLMRSNYIITELDFDLGDITYSVLCKNYMFCAVKRSHRGTDLQNAVLAISLDTGHVRHLIGHSGNVLSLAATEDLVFSASYDETIMVWDTKTLECTKILEGHDGAVRSLCVSEKFLFSGATDSTVCMWSLEKLELYKKICVKTPVSFVTCSKKKFLYCLTALYKVQIWDMVKLVDENLSEPSFEMQVPNTVKKLMTSDNIMFACSRKSVDLIKLGSLRNESTIEAPGSDCVLTSSNKFLVCNQSDNLSLWSTRTGKCVLAEKIPEDGEVVVEFIWAHKGALFASYHNKTTKRKYIRKW